MIKFARDEQSKRVKLTGNNGFRKSSLGSLDTPGGDKHSLGVCLELNDSQTYWRAGPLASLRGAANQTFLPE